MLHPFRTLHTSSYICPRSTSQTYLFQCSPLSAMPYSDFLWIRQWEPLFPQLSPEPYWSSWLAHISPYLFLYFGHVWHGPPPWQFLPERTFAQMAIHMLPIAICLIRDGVDLPLWVYLCHLPVGTSVYPVIHRLILANDTTLRWRSCSADWAVEGFCVCELHWDAQYYIISVLQHFSTSVLQYISITVLEYCSIIMLQCCASY